MMKRTVDLSTDEAESRVRESLAEEGFGVLTEIDVKATFAKKLGIDFRPYRILGACNPGFAHEALEADEDIGGLLPCNVIVYEGADPGTTVLAAVDPVVQLSVADQADLEEMASEVRTRLRRAIEAV
ncbi:MAG: DUF302 domain-containing protein [Gemmatimonadota bacterium]|nr:DUF302 domain-containing protein [Gemmatimonadota bacterium]